MFDAAARAKGATNEGEMADLIGLSRETLWRYRNGLMHPTLATAVQIASRLGVGLDDLFLVGAA